MTVGTAVDRVFNFSAGPAVLPVPVLEEAQRDLLSLPGCGASILEISHRGKQFIALLVGHVSRIDHIVDKHLDIDFVIRAINTGGVVDGVGVHAPPCVRKLDSRELGDAEISTLTDHAALKFTRVNAQGIIRTIADVLVTLIGSLHIGSDSTVPKQIDRRFQHRGHQLAGRHGEREYRLPSTRAAPGQPRKGLP